MAELLGQRQWDKILASNDDVMNISWYHSILFVFDFPSSILNPTFKNRLDIFDSAQIMISMYVEQIMHEVT